jgi:hypothetical protein
MLERVRHGLMLPVKSRVRRSVPITTAAVRPSSATRIHVSRQSFTGERICFGLERIFAGYKFAQTYIEWVSRRLACGLLRSESARASVLESGICKRTFIRLRVDGGLVRSVF